MEQTFETPATFTVKALVIKKAIPKKTADGTKKVSTRVKKDADSEPIEVTQKFTITHGEKSCMVKKGTMSFGIRMGDAGIENVMQHTETKDNENIRTVLTVMKSMKKANVSFADIAARLTIATQSMPQTVKQFVNSLQKPATTKPIAISVAAPVSTDNATNEHGDDNFAIEHEDHEHLKL